MSEREQNIVDAAIRVIVRYGMKRTTMNDIAGEAGISRQTLYAVFAGRDEVLKATIRLMSDRAMAAVEADCAEIADLGGKLDVIFETLVVQPFDMLHATPDAEDIISGFNEASRDELERAYERNRAAIQTVLAPHEAAIRASGLTPRQLSDAVERSMSAFKHSARNKRHLRELLRTLKAQILSVTGAT